MSEVIFESDLDALEKAVVGHLRACSALRGIDIVDREIGDVDDAIAVALEKIGVSIFVSEVELGGIDGDVPAVSGDDSQFTVVIVVNPLSNTSGRSAAALREIVMRRLHHWQPGVRGAGVVTLVPDPERGRPKKATNYRDLTFRLSMTLEQGID